MTGQGTLTRKPDRRLRAVTAALVFWLATVCALGVWWGALVLRQSARIAELEQLTGISSDAANLKSLRTHRMLYSESSIFVILLIGSSAVLVWLYVRDSRRTRALQAFFASVTHELRTPLTSIRLQAESISENLAHDESQKHLFGRLLEDTTRLESQVERTLELARVEGGGPLYTQPIQLKSWLDRMAASWRGMYEGRASFDIEVQDHFVEADPAAMQVILRNLLENSFRHSRRAPLVVTLRAEAREGKIYLRFKDNGDGFGGDPKTLGRIFQKGADSHGAGVGLYLVIALMQRMGGAAQFDSSAGFEVSLCFKEGRTHG